MIPLAEIVEQPAVKAQTLIEALPYIRRFQGTTIVVKYGGSAMESADLMHSVMSDLVLMKYVGIHPILVHGGGREVSRHMEKLGITPRFVEGLRVSDADTVEVVEMVLAGRVNKSLVTAIGAAGGQAVGISGKDGGLLTVEKHEHIGPDGRPVDLGFVGRVVDVNPSLLDSLGRAGYIPVVAPLAADERGHTYNINADTVAGELAAAVGARKFIIMTDVEGILVGTEERLLSTLHVSDVEDLIGGGSLNGGMIPKVQACVMALEAGVRRTHIINGRRPHSLLLEVFTDEGIGTMVVSDGADRS